ncbi:beta-ketoacyl synthase chain length factor [Pseudocitrobacter sp. 73]|uniref:beta-ketoacyl synthase chain length factor n=1 Tax=Pseudocitrobacter sp. 73 TaxID=2605731 RepID=UPI0011EFC0BD|nr:beta-ketoacyl synthase chain length factor [Pseudocitrobacter sp. 73]KAA1049154.1 beta-ketoacyl synthase chain length factor [Pseudocitrobacter sp. 73]
MKLAFNIIDWIARAPGLGEADQWLSWAQSPYAIDPASPQAKLVELPMMTARRLSSGSKLAVECGLTLLRRHAIDAVIYTSRHGELERNYRILSALASEQTISPTDFAMSVHNAAVGNLTIAAKQAIVSSSLSAGRDTFLQGLCEVMCLLQAGHQRILMVDFDGTLPDFYRASLPAQMPTWAFATALVIEAGTQVQCNTEPGGTKEEPALPQSLQFLQNYLGRNAHFVLEGERLRWCWSRT